jgi:ABC-type Na+ transport system ATPase subunit NatA
MDLYIRNVSKTYSNGVQALKDVTLTMPAGMYGLLGPNGAGKSALMRILATLQEPDQGSIRLGDTDVLSQKDKVRQTLGYLPQEFGVYPKVSAESLLDYFALLKGIGERRARLSFDELERRLNAEPGVEHIAFADRLPVEDQFKYQIEVDTMLGAPTTGLAGARSCTCPAASSPPSARRWSPAGTSRRSTLRPAAC